MSKNGGGSVPGVRSEPIFSSGESVETSVSEDTTWISWFCQLKGNEFFCEVDEDFIQDDFNLTGLASQVTYYNFALDTILDVEIPEGELDDRRLEVVEVSAETLYGLIHARYILTARGMHAMLAKFTDGAFGRCPRAYCAGQQVLPVGESDMPRISTVRIFCPMCWDLYFPRSRNHYTLDGAYWGTTFPHLFLSAYPSVVPQRSKERYIPRIYGFKIHESAVQVQRNKYGRDAVPGRSENNGTDTTTGTRSRQLTTQHRQMVQAQNNGNLGRGNASSGNFSRAAS